MKNKTNNQIECELRGPITWNDFLSVKDEIEKKWGKLERTVEMVIFAKGKNDLRIKINNYDSKLVLKYQAKKGEAKFEKEVHIKHGDIPSLIEVLDRLGEKKWTFSYAEKYEVKNGNFSFSFKFGSRIGDFFEIEEMVCSPSEINTTIEKIKLIAGQFGLKLWDNDSFDKISQQAWDNIKPEPLMKDHSIHPLVQKVLSDIASMDFDISSDISITSRLREHNNDYSSLETKFFLTNSTQLLSDKTLKSSIGYTLNVSIIIPSYNTANTILLTLNSIKDQDLTKNELSNIEIIVVDDGSTDRTSEIVTGYKGLLGLKYVKQNNIGRASARNLGANLAKGDILIFVDSDVILESHFIREHAVRHSILDNIVLISFKQNIQLNDVLTKITKNKPDIYHDFRFSREVTSEWLRMHRHVRNIQIRKVRIMDETRNLKDFGQDRVVGIWDLPAMVITNAVSMKKKHFSLIGGFNSQFRGWGMEDTFIGACLIALHNFIIPVFSTGIFHIEHLPRSGNQEDLIKEFNRNVLIYLDLVNAPINRVIKNISKE